MQSIGEHSGKGHNCDHARCVAKLLIVMKSTQNRFLHTIFIVSHSEITMQLYELIAQRTQRTVSKIPLLWKKLRYS